MKNLIYQCYDGPLLPAHLAGIENMKGYASRIGAKYLLERNTKFGSKHLSSLLGKQSYFYDCLKPVHDEKFHKYDNVLYVDIDVFAVEGLEQSIFDDFTAEVGSCTEPLQPRLRANRKKGVATGKMDEKWASVVEKHWNIKLPRTPDGLLKVYNAGLELWSQRGLVKAHKKFVPFAEYFKLIKSSGLPNFYTHDQNYFHAMMKVADMDHVELDNEWNRLIHWLGGPEQKDRPVCDPRTQDTKFVQIQMRGSDHFDAQKLWKITNLPVENWGKTRSGKPFVKGDPQKYME